MSNANRSEVEEGADLDMPLDYMNGLRSEMPSARNNAEGNEVEEENSDNSGGSLSIGNNSFGFNFDSDEMNKIGDVNLSSSSVGMMKDVDDEVTEGSSTLDGRRRRGTSGTSSNAKWKVISRSSSSLSSSNSGNGKTLSMLASLGSHRQRSKDRSQTFDPQTKTDAATKHVNVYRQESSMVSSLTSDSGNPGGLVQDSPDAEASKVTISSGSVTRWKDTAGLKRPRAEVDGAAASPRKSIRLDSASKLTEGREKQECLTEKGDDDNSSDGGYNTDDEDGASSNNATRAVTSDCPNFNDTQPSLEQSSSLSPAALSSSDIVGSSSVDLVNSEGQKSLPSSKREERNAREKDRSFRISQQIDELRNLLSTGGVIVPKGTKSSVLTEAAHYIRMLQQNQCSSEVKRHQLIQQLQMIGSGALGPQAARAVRQAAAQNGIWALGSFGGAPPECAAPPPQTDQVTSTASAPADMRQVTSVEEHGYQQIFESASAAMAIASMGGVFIECNRLFCQLSEYTKKDLFSMTIFNLTARADLQNAFDRISSMISPQENGLHAKQGCSSPIVLCGSMKNRQDLGISVAIIRGDDGVPKCFLVTLLKDVSQGATGKRPVFASFDCLQQATSYVQGADDIKKAQFECLMPETFTTG